jgi:hypothetical protein
MYECKPYVPECGAEVVGHLYEDEDRSVQSEDMIDVLLPNGILISGGWYPEASIQGHYRVAVTEGLTDVVPPKECESIDEACCYIQEVAFRFVQHAFNVSGSGETTAEVVWK